MGRKITLDELFAERAAQLKAEAESPEGIARAARNAEKFRRDEEARLKWEAENPPEPEDEDAEEYDPDAPPEDF